MDTWGIQSPSNGEHTVCRSTLELPVPPVPNLPRRHDILRVNLEMSVEPEPEPEPGPGPGPGLKSRRGVYHTVRHQTRPSPSSRIRSESINPRGPPLPFLQVTRNGSFIYIITPQLRTAHAKPLYFHNISYSTILKTDLPSASGPFVRKLITSAQPRLIVAKLMDNPKFPETLSRFLRRH